ncbi:Carboxypeptidase S1, partial [Hortaea werneckii]
MISSICWGLLPLSNLALAQFPPEPEGIKVLRSKFDNNVTISYKETDICETTPGVHSYAGYVNLPPGSLADLGEANDYPINTFFWFFEARKDPLNAPLSIWMNGGPGSSSMLGLFVENGPCFVNPDSNSTYLSDWSWNNEVNMLYLDQPVQVGLSYDGLQNVTLDLLEGDVTLLNDTDPIPEQNSTFLVGTYPTRESNRTALGTENAAIALWHFAQTWFQEFPGYHPNDSRISIATESYGGRYGPAFAAFFEEQNQRIENGTWSVEGEQYVINLDTLLIINGCIDRPTQWPGYPMMAFNNTYGIESVNETIHEQMLDALYRDGGCLDQIEDCRDISVIYDPENI